MSWRGFFLEAALLPAIFPMLLSCAPGQGGGSSQPGDVRVGYLEKAVCGWFTEAFGFFTLRAVAGERDRGLAGAVPNLEQVSFVTKDRRRLGGYRMRAGGKPRGYVLVGQGNAMQAKDTIALLDFFSKAGLDAYAYDFRGYGLSQGVSRVAAIFSDFVEIINHLNNQGYEKSLLYGASFGGVIFLNAIGKGARYDAAVIDSAPATINHYGCPEELDPISNVPGDSSKIAVIIGGKDRVVSPSESRLLAELVRQRNGKVYERDDLAHPFQDMDGETAAQRWGWVLRFFLNAPARP